MLAGMRRSTRPSASSTVPAVKSQRRGDRGHGWPRSLKVESFFACIYSWLATAVPCRQRAAQSRLRSHKGGVTAATVGSGRSRRSHPSYAYQRAPSPAVWLKYTSGIVFSSLARDSRTTPSERRAVAVVESQGWDDHCHGGQRSLKGESPFLCISDGRTALSTSRIAVTVFLTHNASSCWLVCDGCTIPSASSAVTVAESQRRGDRGHCGPRPCLGSVSYTHLTLPTICSV